MVQFAPYGIAIASLAVFALIPLILNPIAAKAKAKLGLVPGAPPPADYSSTAYRLSRAHMNAVEMMGVFIGVTVAAVLAGAPPFWVNLLAGLFLISRLGHLIVHVRAVGAPSMGPRTVLFIAGNLICILLAFFAIGAVIF